jgi:hypothetical protein
MFVKSKHYGAYLIKAQINLGRFFGQPDADVYVTLREMTMAQKMSFQPVAASGDGMAIFGAFRDALPALVVEHNFYAEEGKPMSAGEVVDLLMEREAVAMAVLDEYKERVMGFQNGEKGPDKSAE